MRGSRIYFIVAATVLTVLAACSKEDAGETGSDMEYTVARVGIGAAAGYSSDGAATRAWEYDAFFPSNTLTDPEHRLFNTALFVFDRDLKLESFNFNDNHTQGGNGSAINSSSGVYTVFVLGIIVPITTGVHYFYYLGNIPSALIDQIKALEANVGSLHKDVFERQVLMIDPSQGFSTLDVITNGDPYHYIDKPNSLSRGYMMSTITSPQPRYLMPLSMAGSGASYPASNGFDLHPGMAFAKVSVAYLPPQDGSGEQAGTLSDVRYQMVNIPTQLYIMPNIIREEVITPHFYDTEGVGFDYDSQEYKDIFAGIETVDDDKWVDATLRNTVAGDMGWAYCIENNNSVPTEGNSTFALVRAVFTPADWADDPGTAAPGETFWRIRDKDSGDYEPGYYRSMPATGASQEPVEYPDGVTYYPVWLRTGERYMVRRNGFYKIAITSVLSAGAPDIASVIAPARKLNGETRSGDTGGPYSGIECVQADTY